MKLLKYFFPLAVTSLFLSGCQSVATTAAAKSSKPATLSTKEHMTHKSKPKKLYQTLELNSSSKEVWQLQKELKDLHDYSYPILTGYYGVYTEGAVMTYEFDHKLPVNGIATPTLQQMIAESVKHIPTPNALPAPYHILVKETIPERLYFYQGNHLLLTSLCNTGIAGARTPIGSFPIYEKYRSQTMRGQNPNGTYYDDPGVPYVMYFSGGCAVHGFIRQQYGFPQSVGCVELPPSVAKQIFMRVPIGTIVTVVNGPAVH
ncbi:L,D-transpeptidase family protein [Sulfoacidibacillus thermotolerans]|uniref:L,D-TPase catalytic domain-containing protein n=1 Tax=Sulfoacidibacillus thermotolerans TaxID=1765684 RepID=A0A2U3DB91_SULT2|nr:L,D-transpeptidase family protein [Sulfoacidibacillus thermotolerans]PWI58543.1 hypothetical protein BM613_03235 [Sulfoacidibacillus thermotolerans]